MNTIAIGKNMEHTVKKLYYTDPLKAAWMAREFGVKIAIHAFGDKNWIPEGVIPRFEWSNNYEDILELWIEDCNADYRGMHPDSYSIFEPQKGDVFIDKRPTINNDFDVYKCDGSLKLKEKHGGLHITYNDDTGGGFVPVRYCEVIQRQGKAFFMPEVKL